jgi:uncharacterized membrane protein (DUF4010 family)
VIGDRRGTLVAGLLGGLVSSTSTALTFARSSRERPEAGRPLAFGILAACALMYVRIVIATGVLNTNLMSALLPYLLPPFLVTVLASLAGMLRRRGAEPPIPEPRNPLQLRSALQMAALFQIVLFAVHAVRLFWGGTGLLVSGGILGLTDVDALTVSMARTAEDPALLLAAAQAIAMGVLSNTLFKAALAVAVGRGAVRTIAVAGLLLGAAASAAMLFVLVR